MNVRKNDIQSLLFTGFGGLRAASVLWFVAEESDAPARRDMFGQPVSGGVPRVEIHLVGEATGACEKPGRTEHCRAAGQHSPPPGCTPRHHETVRSRKRNQEDLVRL